ncbi:RNA-binding S4 domain-containing protein [Enteractinococcus coprophilus]|uniref:Ribosome-associated heat shock protein Hsp15 n=1 Tax=Enteractinococcus coprophilus TaxID=1027633 RepID=A0A543AMH3_9MICC|nr:S4 domain-containing protein [Enteractinococcus coprophilus]TQL73735.1 ribosome-associated heat shock protein Hsp15 [Enteractinococcus coprophilus]
MDFVRVDVWLHAVRLFKTRSAANTAVKGGKIKIDGDPVKPSHKLRVGQTVTFREPGRERIIEVTGLLDKRVGHPIAIKQYKDHSPEPVARHLLAVPRRERGAGRPTKKQRRELDRLRGYTNR